METKQQISSSSSNEIVNSKEELSKPTSETSKDQKNETSSTQPKIGEEKNSKVIDLVTEGREEKEEENEENEEMVNKPAHLVVLSEMFRNIQNHLGDFACGGRVPDLLPWLEVKDVGIVPFPLTEEYAQKLIRCAVRSPFGRKDQTILDDRIRSR